MVYKSLIVLGADQKASKSRVKEALKNYTGSEKVILAGNGCAQYMKEIAEQGGVSGAIAEDKSRESIGNLYKAKTEHLDPNGLKHVAIVSSDYHIPRLERACNKILGKGYEVDLIGSKDPLTSKELYELEKGERLKSIFDKLLLAGPSNDRIIEKKLSALYKLLELKYGKI
jgi:hypothetical protein